VGEELFYVDGQIDRQTDGRTVGRTDRQRDQPTDITKLIVIFRNFAKLHKNRICQVVACVKERRMLSAGHCVILLSVQTPCLLQID